jgi:hypothetical protein
MNGDDDDDDDDVHDDERKIRWILLFYIKCKTITVTGRGGVVRRRGFHIL